MDEEVISEDVESCKNVGYYKSIKSKQQASRSGPTAFLNINICDCQTNKIRWVSA